MPDCPASGKSSHGINKVAMWEPVRYQEKGTQSSTGLQYPTDILDAGMLMLAMILMDLRLTLLIF